MARKTIDLSRYTDLQYDVSKNNVNSIPVYGPFEKLYLSDWGQSDIHFTITQAFNKMNINRMTPLQKNSFLYLMHNYNTAMVGFSKGKSISYLASIFSLIMNSKSNTQQKSDLGPKAIILSSSLGSCSVLEDLSKQLLCLSNGKINIVVAYSSVSVQRTIAALCNGCDVFIATPTSFHDLLSKTKLFSWSNLKHIVFDNIDLLLENYEDLMIHFSRILLSIKVKINGLQMISVSVKWTHKVHTFLSQLFLEWQYIFGSHLEAARYRNVNLSVVPGIENKLEKIIENLKYNIKWYRCILVTKNPKELSKILQNIKLIDDDIEILLPEGMKCTQVYTLQKWNSPSVKNKQILICSDDMLFEFYVDNADCLIHYDIPAAKKTFSTRFSVLQDSTNSLSKLERSTYIFLSNSNEDMLQFPKVVEIMKVFGNGNVPPVLLKNAKLINESLEKEKKHQLLCNSVIQFGSCPRLMSCQNRHVILKEIDEPFDNFPKSGLAIVQILNIYDASHISAKILKLNCTNNPNDVQQWTQFSDNSDIIDDGLSLLYADHHSRKLHTNPVIGDVVAVQIDCKIKEHRNTDFFRAIVVDSIDKNTINPKLMVKLIDLGYVDIVSRWKVYYLPDEWKNIPPSTADLFLISVKPVDFDRTWCSKADSCVKKSLKHAQDCNSTFVVKIKMALGTTIWIKKLYKKFFNPKLGLYEFQSVLPDILIDKSYANMNSEHLDKLTELCVSAGIEIPLLLNTTNLEEIPRKLSLDDFMSLYKLPQPQWAHLDEKITSVSLEYVLNPKIIFVLNTKYFDRIKVLNKTITEFIENKKVEKLKHLVEGALCLAKNTETEQYSRCQIIGLPNSDGCVQVMFVDLGDFEWVQPDSLLTIHPNLITQLPFQVIECGLSGILDDLPSGEELDKLVNYILDSTEKLVYIEIIDTIPSGKFTRGNHYEVLLFNDLITVNFEFSEEFSQYCDNIQMSELQQLPYANDKEEDKDVDKPIEIVDDPCKDFDVFADSDFYIQFYKSYLMPVLGPKYLEVLEKNIKVDNPEECPLVITDVAKPVTASFENEHNDCSTDVTEPDNAALENEHNDCFTAPKSVEKSKSNDVQCIVPIDCGTLDKQVSKKNLNLKGNNRHKNPCSSCNIIKHSIVPMCTWYQDRSYIYLKFNILEVDKFCVDCTTQSITLKAQFKDVSYTFHVNLFCSIIDTSETHKINYDGFHIKAEKMYKTDYKWPRLFLCQNWHRYLKYDPDHIETKDLEPWIIAVNKIKMKALDTPLYKGDTDINDCNSDVCEWYDIDEFYDD